MGIAAQLERSSLSGRPAILSSVRTKPMSDRKLDIAFWNYDRTRLLSDGSVRIEGVEARFHSARIVPEIFEHMIRDRAYDVSELGMTYFLRTFDSDEPPFLALPVFLNRCFRHSAIYINKTKGIERPQDLAGKRVGELALYGHDAGVMSKGILSDDGRCKPDGVSAHVGLGAHASNRKERPDASGGFGVTHRRPVNDVSRRLMPKRKPHACGATAPISPMQMAREESLNSLNRLTRQAPAKRIKPVQPARMQVCASG